jgi:excisionase family DNA binding protein
MSALARALLDDLAAEDLRELAERLAPYLPTPPPPTPDRWLTTREAAEHLGLSVHALHRLTAERSIPFEQDGPGARCYFQRQDLDAWRKHRREGTR